MRKAALQLLGELLASNPFGPQLPEADFAASLAHFRARLQEMDPQPEEKLGAGAQWPEGQGIKPDPDANPGGSTHAPGDEEGAAVPGAAGTGEREEEDAQVWGCRGPLEAIRRIPPRLSLETLMHARCCLQLMSAYKTYFMQGLWSCNQNLNP